MLKNILFLLVGFMLLGGALKAQLFNGQYYLGCPATEQDFKTMPKITFVQEGTHFRCTYTDAGNWGNYDGKSVHEITGKYDEKLDPKHAYVMRVRSLVKDGVVKDYVVRCEIWQVDIYDGFVQLTNIGQNFWKESFPAFNGMKNATNSKTNDKYVTLQINFHTYCSVFKPKK